MPDEYLSEHGATSRIRRMAEHGFDCPQSRMVAEPWPVRREGERYEPYLARVSAYFR